MDAAGGSGFWFSYWKGKISFQNEMQKVSSASSQVQHYS